jgi:hypothetical protein
MKERPWRRWGGDNINTYLRYWFKGWIGFIGFCERGNEPLVSIKCWEILD